MKNDELSGSWTRSSLVVVCLGLVGSLAALWVAPKMIAWYFETPVSTGFNCRPATEWAMEKLRWAQVSGLVIGGIVGVLWNVVSGRRRAPAKF